MNQSWYTFQSTIRIVLLTLNVGILIAILIEGYINSSWETMRIILLIIISLNILRFVIGKPKQPETKTNANLQTPPKDSGQQ